jgi:hypothetical protein
MSVAVEFYKRVHGGPRWAVREASGLTMDNRTARLKLRSVGLLDALETIKDQPDAELMALWWQGWLTLARKRLGGRSNAE